MTADEAYALWRSADEALRASRLEDAERLSSALVTELETADPSLEFQPPLNLGLALGLLANVRGNRGVDQDGVDVFENALKRMQHESPSLRLSFVWLNYARYLEYLAQEELAVSAAIMAAREVAHLVRSLEEKALYVFFQSIDILKGCRRLSEEFLEPLHGVLAAADGATPKRTRILCDAHEELTRILLGFERYAEALPHAEFMVSLQMARYGERSVEAADARMDYGLALDQTGNYKHAELHYRKALEAYRMGLGENHASVTRARQNLAELCRVRGDLEGAEQQFRALELEDQERHPLVTDRNAHLLVNFGQTLTSLRRYEEAAEKLNAALEIRAARCGMDSKDYARVLMSLGQLELMRGRYAEAAAMLHQASAIYSSAGEPNDFVQFQASVAEIYLDEPKEAGRHTRELIAKQQTHLGEYHPEVVGMLSHLVNAEIEVLAKTDWSGPLRDQAKFHLEELDDLGRFSLVDDLSSLGERALRAVLSKRRQWQLLYLSLVMCEAVKSRETMDRAWRFVVRYRAAETTALRLRARHYITYDPSKRQDRIAEIKTKLARIDLDLAKKEDRQLRSDRSRLVDEIAEIEFHLAASTSQYRLDYEFITQEAPVLHLGDDAAVLTVSNYHQLKGGGECYAVFVAKGAEPVHLVDLGTAQPIDEAIARYRQAVSTEGRRASPDEEAWRAPGLWLAEHILGPLQPYLTGVRQLRVLADGPMALINLSALPKSGGGFVLDDFDITYDVSVAKNSLITFEEDHGIDAPPAVIGAPQFTTETAAAGHPDDETEFLAQFRSGARFEFLAHAEEECREIAALLEVSPLIGHEATENAFASFRSPEVLHVCTHGFYLNHLDSEGTGGQTFGLHPRASLMDSLDRTGLAFSGANDHLDGRSTTGGGDGIVYGSEIATFDMMRTDLVTLSACQTGLGDVAKGDGVHGLQRAFLSAGARTVVCSLWEVPDAPTRHMFTGFYARVMAGEPRGEAFHQTVRELAARYPHHPVAWGGFILIGRTDPLARFSVRKWKIGSISGRELGLGDSDSRAHFPALQAEDLVARAHEQARDGEFDDGLATLKAGMEIAGVPASLITEMMYTAAGIQRKAGRYKEAELAYAELERRPDVPPRLHLAIIFDAGTNCLLAGDWERAVERYTSVLKLDPPINETAMALVNRAGAYIALEDFDPALADLTRVIDSPTAPSDQRAKALLTRAQFHLNHGDLAGATADADAVIDRCNADPDAAAHAWLIKGIAAWCEGRSADGLNHLNRAHEISGVSPGLMQVIEEKRSQMGSV